VSLFRRDQGDASLPWAADREQAELQDGQNVMDRLTPIQLTPTTWGDDLRNRRLPRERERSWYVSWALGLGLLAVLACVFGLYWTAASLFLLAAWVLVLLRFPKIPRWTWVVVLLLAVLFVAPFDLLGRSPAKTPRHPAQHAALPLREARQRDGVTTAGDELGKL
jgi:hypothetical protein